jgi:hypothetical protein
MEKSQVLRRVLKNKCSLKLHKETLRQLESFDLQAVAGGNPYTLDAPSCMFGKPCGPN